MAKAAWAACSPPIKPIDAQLTAAYLAARRPEEAAAAAERSLALQKQSCASPEERAVAEWGLSRALHSLKRDLPRARELAQSARGTFVSLPSQRQDVADIDAASGHAP